MPGQKCMSGDSIFGDYYDSYYENNSVKIEIWNATFYQKDKIYIDNDYVLFNNHVSKIENTDYFNKFKHDYTEEDKTELLSHFPTAKSIQFGWDDDIYF